MKKIFLIALLSLTTSVFAQNNVRDKLSSKCEKQNLQMKVAKNSSKENLQDLISQRSGCCSWHGGVCGCSNGRAVCCDGEFSPTCGCD